MLTGQAKTDYQREYMRRRRSNVKGFPAGITLDPKASAVLDPSESVRNRLIRMSIPEIQAMQGFVPNWRLEQG